MWGTQDELRELSLLLEGWDNDPGAVKAAFASLRHTLEAMEDVVLRFHPRPGVSYSMRAGFRNTGPEDSMLFALVDIVEDPSERWLSVCFYEQMIADPMEKGEVVPKGLLGEDGYCFHVTEYDHALISYLKERIWDAYGFARSQSDTGKI